MIPAIESRERREVRAGEIVGWFELTTTHTVQKGRNLPKRRRRLCSGVARGFNSGRRKNRCIRHDQRTQPANAAGSVG